MSRRHCGKKVGEGRGKGYVPYKSKNDQDIPKCIIIRNFSHDFTHCPAHHCVHMIPVGNL